MPLSARVSDRSLQYTVSIPGSVLIKSRWGLVMTVVIQIVIKEKTAPNIKKKKKQKNNLKKTPNHHHKGGSKRQNNRKTVTRTPRHVPGY